MNRRTPMGKLLVTVTVTLALAAPAGGEVDLERLMPSERSVLAAGKEVQGDYFAFGPHVEISGTVHGDVYAAGGEVLVDGVIDGDLIVAGAKVIVSGTVSQDARIAGAQVTIGGTIGRNLTVAGGDVQVMEPSHIRGNVLAGAGNVQLAGQVDGETRVGAGNVVVSSRIGGDLAAAAGAIRLTSKASVGRNFRYWSEQAPSIDEGATIRGTVSQRSVPEMLKAERLQEGLTGLRLTVRAVNFVSTLLLGLILARVYPVFSLAVGRTIGERPMASLGAGAAALVGVPLMILVCFATVLAIPLGLVLGALYVATLYLGRVFVMVWAGQWLLLRVSDSPSPGWSFVTGLVLYSLLTFLPLAGGIVMLLTVLTGLGALLLTKKALVERLREERRV